MLGAVVTASFVMAGTGAFYLLARRHEEHARGFLRTAVPVGAAAALLLAFPTGDRQARAVHDHQPEAFAAMEGHFETSRGAPLVLVGQPDLDDLTLDNPIALPKMLSFLTHYAWTAEVKGLKEFPREDWPDNVALLYYAYHVMAGLGTIFVLVLGFACWRLRKGALFASRPLLWTVLLVAPFAYVANTAGWLTAELGRQPWVIRGLMRTADGFSDNVSAGNALFTLLGFLGIYAALSFLFVVLMGREIAHGPED
jgi:cytochrome d ubiquinol oxidase subunit I